MTSPALPDVDALLPCPFCGGAPVFDGHPGGVMGQIRCSNHDCFGPKTTALHRADSIQQWNTRASPAPKSDSGLGMTATIEQWPGREAAEGVETCDLLMRLQGYLDINRRPGNDLSPKFSAEISALLAKIEAAPQKPAPDAMREALADRLAHAIVTMQNDDLSEPMSEKRDRHVARSETMRDVVEYLRSAAPVPPAEGALERLTIVANDLIGEAFCADWHGDPDQGVREVIRIKKLFIERLNVFACDEITRSRLRSSTSPAGAAAPVAWRWQHVNDRREPRPWHYEDAPWHGNEYMQAEPLYAAPPVMDREAIAEFVERAASEYSGDAIVYNGAHVANILATQATRIRLLSLPVQPGAGDRDICQYCDSEMEKDACSACGRERVPPEGYTRPASLSSDGEGR